MFIADVSLFRGLLIRQLPIDSLDHLPPGLIIVKPTDNTAIAMDFPLFMFNVGLRSLALLSVGVLMDKNVLIFPKKSIDIFECPVRSLRVEEIGERDKAEVENSPDDVELPVQTLDPDGCDFHYHKVDDPVGGSSQGGALCSHREGVDFGRLKPWHTLEADTEEYIIEEKECYRGGCDLFGGSVTRKFTISQENGDNHVAKTLSSSSIHDHFAATPALLIVRTFSGL